MTNQQGERGLQGIDGGEGSSNSPPASKKPRKGMYSETSNATQTIGILYTASYSLSPCMYLANCSETYTPKEDIYTFQQKTSCV